MPISIIISSVVNYHCTIYRKGSQTLPITKGVLYEVIFVNNDCNFARVAWPLRAFASDQTNRHK